MDNRQGVTAAARRRREQMTRDERWADDFRLSRVAAHARELPPPDPVVHRQEWDRRNPEETSDG